MGRFSIKIDIDMKILKYWIHLDSLDDNKIVKQAFLMSRTQSDSRHKSFHSYIRGLLHNIGRPKTEILYPLNFNINNGVNKLKEKYINLWRQKLQNSEKLSFYKEIKIKYEPENYLMSERNISFRKEVTKLRISNHDLMIERGRYFSPKLPRDERFCSTCSDNKIEDEKHFIIDCDFYNQERNALSLWFLTVKNIDFNQLDLNKKIEILFNNDDPQFLAIFSKHIFTCMKKRRDFISD